MRSQTTISLAMALSSTIIAAMLTTSPEEMVVRDRKQAVINEGPTPSKDERDGQKLSMVKDFGMR